MEEIRQIQKRYGSAVMAVAIPAALVLILLGMPSAGKGLVLGALFSILNFVLMGRALPLRIGRTRNASTAISLGSIGFRFLVLAIPLIASVRLDAIHPAATVVGIFMVQIVILADHLIDPLRRRVEKRA